MKRYFDTDEKIVTVLDFTKKGENMTLESIKKQFPSITREVSKKEFNVLCKKYIEGENVKNGKRDS
jgi:hypothetical protein